MSDMFSTPEFEAEYTYHGSDLGATWTKKKTTFRLWAPTARWAKVCLYKSGNLFVDDRIRRVSMKPDVNGTWVAEIKGDLNGVYYTYQVSRNRRIVEVCDPYAKTTGANGHRAMVIDLNSTNPEGWEKDRDPNAGIRFTDAVIALKATRLPRFPWSTDRPLNRRRKRKSPCGRFSLEEKNMKGRVGLG